MKNNFKSRSGLAFGILMVISFFLIKIMTAEEVTSSNILPMFGVSLAQGVFCGLGYGWIMKVVKVDARAED